MHVSSPAWLLLLVVVLLLLVGYIVLQRRRKRYTVRFSNTALLASVAPRHAGWRRHVSFALLLAALAVLIVGSAGPTAAVRVARDRATIMLAIDVSPSMVATDVKPDRLEASQAGARLFVNLVPPEINIGLVKFGGIASVIVPPTTNRTSLTDAINQLTLVNSTAIGEAVFTCLDALTVFEKSTTAAGRTVPPARIVLMSDGSNNTGRSVQSAAAAAKQAGVPVSTIAFGTDGGTVTIQGQTIPVPADKATLSALAAATGGSFHTAASAAELRSVYTNIGSQIGYTTTQRNISWRFLTTGFLLALLAAASSLLWAPRLP